MFVFNIEMLEDLISNGDDVKYKVKKGEDINIKPMLVKNYNDYMNIKDIFSIDKNEFGDQFVSMSSIEFIVAMLCDNNELSFAIYKALLDFTQKCLGYADINFEQDNGRMCIVLCDKDKTIKSVLRPKEFDEIKKIFLFQNDSNYIDVEISQDMKQIMKEYYDLKYKDINIPTLEQKKAFVSSKIGKTFKELGELPIREFELVYQSCVDSEIYIAQKIIQGSYKYEVKEDIPFPLYEKKKDPFEEVLNGKSGLNGISGVEGIGQGIE